MQNASVQPESVEREVLCGCLTLLWPVLEACTSSTDLHDESDLLADAIGAIIEVIQRATLFDSMSDMVHTALGCFHYLTSIPAGQQQALQLLTVDKIEDLLRAALTWLEDDSQPEKNWAMATCKATILPICVSYAC